MLTARADGTKELPFVLINRQRTLKGLDQFRDSLHIYYCGRTNWFNDTSTAAYLTAIFHSRQEHPRLLVWDAFTAHTSNSTKGKCADLSLHTTIVPGGCTGLVQPADVSWNRPFKAHLETKYATWMATGERSFTRSER